MDDIIPYKYTITPYFCYKPQKRDNCPFGLIKKQNILNVILEKFFIGVNFYYYEIYKRYLPHLKLPNIGYMYS